MPQTWCDDDTCHIEAAVEEAVSLRQPRQIYRLDTPHQRWGGTGYHDGDLFWCGVTHPACSNFVDEYDYRRLHGDDARL